MALADNEGAEAQARAHTPVVNEDTIWQSPSPSSTIGKQPSKPNDSASDPKTESAQHAFWARPLNALKRWRSPMGDNDCPHGEKASLAVEKRSFPPLVRWLSCMSRPKTELTIRSLKKFPRGYPNFAAFLDSDDGFMIYRRYGYLQSRILLEKQDELRSLEAQLDAMDEAEMCRKPDKLFTRDRQGEERKGLLIQIEKSFCEYAKILAAAQQLMSFNRPGNAEHRSALNYVEGLVPVKEEESTFMYCKEDLITLRHGREYAWLDRIIERTLQFLHCRPLEWIFCTKESKSKSLDSDQVYYDRRRIGGCSAIIVTLVIVFMLIIPIYLEYHIVASNYGLMTAHKNAICIGILLVFTLAFSAIMTFFTKAKRHEILAAAAAYCAVLVVFLGNVGNGTVQK